MPAKSLWQNTLIIAVSLPLSFTTFLIKISHITMICVFSTSYEIYSTSISSYFVIERADACLKKNRLLISDSEIKNFCFGYSHATCVHHVSEQSSH